MYLLCLELINVLLQGSIKLYVYRSESNMYLSLFCQTFFFTADSSHINRSLQFASCKYNSNKVRLEAQSMDRTSSSYGSFYYNLILP